MTTILAKALHDLKVRRPQLAAAVRMHDQATRAQRRKAASSAK